MPREISTGRAASSGRVASSGRFLTAAGNAAPTIALSGAAFLATGDMPPGLHVQKPGTNLFTNPSAGIDTTGAVGTIGVETIERQATGGILGGSCWKVTTTGTVNEGIMFTSGGGAFDVPAADADHDKYSISFWAKLVTAQTGISLTTASVKSWRNDPDFALRTAANNQLIAYGWRRFKLTVQRTVYDAGPPEVLADNDLSFAFYPCPAQLKSTVFLIDGITIEAERSGTAYDPGYPDGISYPTAPYNGDSPGCAWTGTAHASTSIRTMGKADYPGSDIDIDFNSSFWFGMDMTVGVGSADDYETICTDMLTVGKTDGTMGFESNIGLDYAFETVGTHRLQLVFFPNDPATYAAVINLPTFLPGTIMRSIGVYDATAATITLYAVFDNGAILTDTADCPAPPTLPDGYTVGIGYLDFGGPWQDNSAHRYLALEQGVPTARQIESYLRNPSAPILNGGYFFPLIDDTDCQVISRAATL